MKKKTFIGWTTKDWSTVWTFFNTLNLAFIIQKTRNEAMARYGDDIGGKDIKKIRITIEDV